MADRIQRGFVQIITLAVFIFIAGGGDNQYAGLVRLLDGAVDQLAVAGTDKTQINDIRAVLNRVFNRLDNLQSIALAFVIQHHQGHDLRPPNHAADPGGVIAGRGDHTGNHCPVGNA